MKKKNKRNRAFNIKPLIFILLISGINLSSNAQTRISTWINSTVYQVAENTGTGLAQTEQKDIRSYLEVIAYDDDVFRITVKPDDKASEHPSLVVLQDPPDIEAQVNVSGEIQRLKTGSGSVEVNTRTGSLKFYDAMGSKVLMTPDINPFRFDSVVVEGEETMKIHQKFVLGEEALYGLGQFYNDSRMNWRGQTRMLVQANHHAINPTLISTGGWGLYWDNYSRTIFRDFR